MNKSNEESKNIIHEGARLKFLSIAQVMRIDELLTQLGEYGEVHLVVQHGELRYFNKVESYKAWKTDQES